MLQKIGQMIQSDQANSDEDLKLYFNFRVRLKSTEPINEISHPANCEIIEQSLNDVLI